MGFMHCVTLDKWQAFQISIFSSAKDNSTYLKEFLWGLKFINANDCNYYQEIL